MIAGTNDAACTRDEEDHDMKLSEIIQGICDIHSCSGDAEITGLSHDSRQTKKGDLHFCLPGLKSDGHDYAKQAIEQGAAALVVTHKLDFDVPQVIVSDARAAMAHLSQRFYGNPAKDMVCVGITGTKGKTTTAYLVAAIAKAAGHKVGLSGTVSTMIGDQVMEATLTTPESIDMQRYLAQMRDAGCSFFVTEASAHALAFKRLEGMVFDAGIYTNLSQDHLDFFGDMETYRKAKQEFFNPKFLKRAVINVDDEQSAYMAHPDVPTTTYGVAQAADVYANDIEICESGVSYTLTYHGDSISIEMKISGIFNVYNSMAAAACCLDLGMSMEEVKRGLESVTGVPGRIEPLQTNTPYRVILDYAHSPAALESILATIRQFTQGRLICVFGCGGGRDKDKRPVMGEISGRLADYSILTSDNPRNEVPEDILRSIEEGILPTGGKYSVIENRREAIRSALLMAQQGDIIVLAGKGHETYQEINGVKTPFDEKAVVAELLEEMGLD